MAGVGEAAYICPPGAASCLQQYQISQAVCSGQTAQQQVHNAGAMQDIAVHCDVVLGTADGGRHPWNNGERQRDLTASGRGHWHCLRQGALAKKQQQQQQHTLLASSERLQHVCCATTYRCIQVYPFQEVKQQPVVQVDSHGRSG